MLLNAKENFFYCLHASSISPRTRIRILALLNRPFFSSINSYVKITPLGSWPRMMNIPLLRLYGVTSPCCVTPSQQLGNLQVIFSTVAISGENASTQNTPRSIQVLSGKPIMANSQHNGPVPYLNVQRATKPTAD